LELDQQLPKRGGHWAKARFGFEGLDHEEVKAQEGKANCQDTNHGLAMWVDFHADESPVDDERRGAQFFLGTGTRA
jgi:hypothetical protein